MLTLTLDDIKKANTIFDCAYKAFKDRVMLFNFKLKRSPEIKMFKSVREYSTALNKLSENDTMGELGNDFTCIELGGELQEHTLKNHDFIQHCIRLLDGSHELLKFGRPVKYPADIEDVKLVKVIAEKSAMESEQWKKQVIEKGGLDYWQIDFCIADFRCVAQKCQSTIDLDAQVESSVTVSRALIQEWWNTIEKNQSVSQQIYDKYHQ